MKRRGHRQFVACGLIAVLAASLLASSCQPLGLVDAAFRFSEADSPDPFRFHSQPTVADLAYELDSLEGDIERDGSVVAEQPSVWGQARLTMYREEFEQQMQPQLTKFQPTLQGSLFRSDQAYAADALALSFTAQAASLGTGSGSKGAASSSSSSSSGGSSTSPSAPVPNADPTGSTFNSFNSVTRTPVVMPSPLGFGATGQAGLSLEPTIYLDQMKRYIDHLHELRRMSDGDDTADAPGYSLNLVRIPVSVLPGRCTQQRYGAEITFTLRPHLHDELLPMTFHNLVLNDLIDQIGVPLTYTLNDRVWQDALGDLWDQMCKENPVGTDISDKFVDMIASVMDPRFDCSEPQFLYRGRSSAPPPTASSSLVKRYESRPKFQALQKRVQYQAILPAPPRSSTRLRNARHPFPPSELVDIYGARSWAQIVMQARQLFHADIPNKGVIHYPDVENFLQEELEAAYSFLKVEQNQQALWQYCDDRLVDMIHGRDVNGVKARRCAFEKTAITMAAGVTAKPELTAALAWAILVDSALLNKQLVEDMKNAPAARGGFALPAEWLPYYLPHPPQQVREAFSEYVRCRWPIHVFSLDPELDQQNIADSYSSRREMQLAMSLAFVSGKLSANNMFRYARRLETDMETIALNNTAVGFSHGTETFGWRFYPRFQSPDTDCNLKVCLQDLLYGGPSRNELLRERRLEPGIRECVAIVLMPSFVPYADLDASSNWFALDNPHCKLMNSAKAIRLGEQVRRIQNCAQMTCNPQCYRDGDLDRLMRRAQQLESRLPLQSMSVQVPYENTLGGFAMFNTGVTDLSPELLGWYGAPAINLDAPTTIFLIGNHFSVHQTRVLIGGQEITAPELLSRQVMKVTIPSNAIALVSQTGDIAGGWKVPTIPTAQNHPAPTKALLAGVSPAPAPGSVPAPPPTLVPVPASRPATVTPAVLIPTQDERSLAAVTSPPAAGSNPSEESAARPEATATAPATGTTPPASAASPPPATGTTPPAAGTTPVDTPTISTRSTQSVEENGSLIFSAGAIKLTDPAGLQNRDELTLTASHGTLTLGATDGVSFASGANGSASLAVTGTVNNLISALNGLAYAPSSGYSGADTLSVSLKGSGANATCAVSVALAVNPSPPTPPKPDDFLYVDVQLATPYGATSHLLVPAWHLGKTGAGSLAPVTSATPPATTGTDPSPAVSKPQWTTAQWTVGYVNNGIGIAAGDPPSYTPNALTVNLGTNYLVPSDNAVTLKLKLGGNANGNLQPLKIAIVPGKAGTTTGANYDPTSHVLTITGKDLDNLSSDLFGVIQYEFGSGKPTASTSAPIPMETTVSGTGQTDISLINPLTVNLVSSAAKPTAVAGGSTPAAQ